MNPQGAGDYPLGHQSVLEVGDDLAVRYSGLILASLGARVTRVEGLGRAAADASAPEADERERLSLDRGKRSAVLDLDSASGLAILARVARHQDAVLADPSGAGGQLVRALGDDPSGPALCVISDFRSSDQAVPELILEATTGIADLTGEEDGPPSASGVPVCAILAGLYAAIAILAVTGQDTAATATPASRRITIAKSEASLAIMAYLALTYLVNGDVPHRTGTGHPSVVPYGAFRAADGELVAAPFTQRFWRRFCRAIDRPDLVDDERFADLAARARHRIELVGEIEKQTRTQPVETWLSALLENDVPCGPVLTMAQASALTDSLQHGLTHDVGIYPGGAPVRLPSMPFLFTRPGGVLTPALNRQAPRRGAHTAELLAETEQAAE
jgi:crotonobetainyl-CoA:carnitine CoA-transferase CaiB-like acyl-CoA transferase